MKGKVEPLYGKEAEKFVTWLTMVKGFLPKSMTISEAQEIFMRRRDDEKKEQVTAN